MIDEPKAKELLPHEWTEIPAGLKPEDPVPGSPTGRKCREQMFLNNSSRRVPGGNGGRDF